MSSFTESAKANSANGANATFHLRWRGKKEGPYTANVIDTKLQANEIGLLHELLHNGQWITVRDFIASGEAILRAERQAKEDRERQLREQDERRQREASDKASQPPIYHPSPNLNATATATHSFNSPLVRNAVVVLIALVCICLVLWAVVTLIPQFRNIRQQANSETEGTKTTVVQTANPRAGGSDAAKNAVLARINSLEADYRNYSSELIAKQSEQAAYNTEIQDYVMDHKLACLALGIGTTGAGVLVASNKKNSDSENVGALIAIALGGSWAISNPDEAKEVGNVLMAAAVKQQDFQKQVATLQQRKDSIANELKLERAKLN